MNIYKYVDLLIRSMDDILAECDDSDDDYGDDEDEDVNVGTDKKRNKQMKKKRGSNSAAGISIREDPDSIVDFTDNTINKNITGKPEQVFYFLFYFFRFPIIKIYEITRIYLSDEN